MAPAISPQQGGGAIELSSTQPEHNTRQCYKLFIHVDFIYFHIWKYNYVIIYLKSCDLFKEAVAVGTSST